jgi:hypothetical protein
MDEEAAEPEPAEPDPEPTPKKSKKRGVQEEKSQPKKRQKKEATPSDLSDEDLSLPAESSSEENAESEFGEESDISDAPKPKRSGKPKAKAPVKRGSNKKRRVAESDESGDDESTENSVNDSDKSSDTASTPPKKKVLSPKKSTREAPSKAQKKSKEIVDSDGESDDGTHKKNAGSLVGELESSSPMAKTTPRKAAPQKESKKPTEEAEVEAGTKANDSDSEMSVVLDETPKPKRQRKTKAVTASSKISKPIKESKAKPAKEAKDLSPNEIQIKTLQSQLVKCGLRKIWGIELKKYGEDNNAKIRHLSGMLKEIGMTGRFSDARAREIKELRELQADLEAVKEGESKWGMESGKRARRGAAQRKSFKESTDEEEDGGESEGSASTPKIERARKELAFLGDDDDDSDSD